MKFFIQPVIQRFSAIAKEQGFHNAVVSFTQMSQSVIKPSIPGSVIPILKDKPVLLLTNHPYLFEIPALISVLPQREDIYIVVNEIFMGLSEEFDKHFIPVSIRHNISSSIGNILLFFYPLFHRYPKRNKTEAQLYNRTHITQTASLLDQHHVVILAPNPGLVSGQHTWYPGVAHLLKQVKDPASVSVIFAHSKGSSLFDFLRFIPFIAKLFPTFYVSLSEVQSIDPSFIKNAQPRELMQHIKKSYDTWVTSTEHTNV
jgi:hypothetical protein